MNSYGTLFKVHLYGESHQEAIGVLIDGVPPGIKIDEQVIEDDLKRRQPGAIGTTPRIEKDAFEITSGVFSGYSTGSPIHIMIRNTNVKSKDYEHLKKQPRPGHADFVSQVKYHGYQDYRGGGRFSGRLTAALTIAGSIAKMMIPFKVSSVIKQIGSLTDLEKLDEYLKDIQAQGDSVGGIIELTVKEMIVGIGEPFFSKLDAEIAKMMMSIPAVKAVSIGDGFESAHLLGSEFNDVIIDEKGTTQTNHQGGISGGISNGNDLRVSVFVKPTSSIQKPQQTFDLEAHQVSQLQVGGRHDVCIARRVPVVLENALAIVLADQYLLFKAYQ